MAGCGGGGAEERTAHTQREREGGGGAETGRGRKGGGGVPVGKGRREGVGEAARGKGGWGWRATGGRAGGRGARECSTPLTGVLYHSTLFTFFTVRQGIFRKAQISFIMLST